jgi:hydroxymethylbilane synthase
MARPRILRVGTRGSLLAVRQTGMVVDGIQRLNPGLVVEVTIIRTTGDRRQDVAFADVGTKGMFVKEIEDALLSGEIDLAVHSLKDLPDELPGGLAIAAIPARIDPRDALVSSGQTLAELPTGARVGTSSLRRQSQVREARPDIAVLELRGNLDTRVRKLDAGDYDAIVVACAGLERLGRAERIVERLDPSVCVPAPGQGALAIETRLDDRRATEAVALLQDRDTADAVAAERAFMRALGAGCTVPAGALAMIDGDAMTVTAMFARNGAVSRATVGGGRSDAVALGERAARMLARRQA